jgi:hypothetical protein
MKINHRADIASRRANEYPKVEDQLDAIWHAMNNGQLPKIEGFYENIKAVKDRHPKKE